MRYLILILVLILVSCGTTKKNIHETENKTNTDTIIKHDTVRMVRNDSTYKKRYKQLQEQFKSQSDSIIFVTLPGKTITKTYGQKTESQKQEKTIDSLYRINSIQKDRISSLENYRSQKVDTETHTKEVKRGFNVWKWIALAFMGISLVLYVLLRRKYISL